MCLSGIALRIPDGLNYLFSFSLNIIQSGSFDNKIISFRLLTLLPNEIDSFDCSRNTKNGIESSMINHLAQIFRILEYYIDSDEISIDFRVMLLKILYSWIPYGISLTCLYENHNSVFSKLLLSSFEIKCDHLIVEVLTILEKMSSLRQTPESSDYSNIVHLICNKLVQSYQYLSHILSDESNSDISSNVVNSFLSIITNFLPIIASPQSFHIDMFEMLLSILKSSRKYTHYSFDFWMDLQDLPLADRHVYLSKEIFYKYFDILFDHCSYKDVSRSDDDEIEIIQNIRDSKQGIQEIFFLLFSMLESLYFESLKNKLLVSDDNMTLETVLYILNLSMPSIKEFIDSKKDSSPIEFINVFLGYLLSDEVRFSLNINVIISVFKLPFKHGENLLSLYPSNPSIYNSLNTQHNDHPSLFLETSCKFLGSCTFILTNHKMLSHISNKYYALAVLYLYISISSISVSISSSKSFLQLAIHGMDLLVSSFPSKDSPILIFHLIEGMDEIFQIDLPKDSVLNLLEAIVRTLARLPRDLVQQQLSLLGVYIQKSLSNQFQSGIPINIDKIKNLLSFISQIIRFCDELSDITSDLNLHVLFNFFSIIWPILREVESNSLIISHQTLLEEIFSIYSRSISSAGFLISSEIPRIVDLIFKAFDVTNYGYSLTCGIVLIEFYSSVDQSIPLRYEIQLLLTQLLSSVLKTVEAKLSHTTYEPESIDNLFSFIYGFQIHAPDILTVIDCLHLLPILLLHFINTCKEREPLRTLLQVCQALYIPVTEKLNHVKHIMIPMLMHFSENILIGLFNLLTDGRQSSLMPNTSETIFCVLSGCIENYGRVMAQQSISIYILDPKNVSKVPLEYRTALSEVIMILVLSDKRKFKALMYDISKISSSELTPDTLGSYF